MRTGAQAASAYPVRPRTSSPFSFSFFLSSSMPAAPFSLFTLFVVSTLVQLACSPNYALALPPVHVTNQGEILRRFKATLLNAGEPALADWESNPAPPCDADLSLWRGVICFNGYVWGLQLEGMGLAGPIDVDALKPLQLLRTLSFQNNTFEGSMPDWRKLGALKSLYVSNNRFSGELPDDAFKGMSSMKKVYMANNRFTGKIPTSLQSPKLLELRLENNQFSGRIPLIASKHLKVMNVSNNQLEGPIPEHLQMLDPSSFSGNKGLCGPPVGNTCPPDFLNKRSPAMIAVIAALCLLGLLLLVMFLICICRGGKKRKSNRRQPVAASAARATSRAAPARAAASTAGAKAAATASGATTAAAGAAKRPETGQRLTFMNEGRRKFDLQDLMRASAEVLGSGNFGASYKAILVDGEGVVVKRFKQMNNVAREDFHEHMRRLGRLKHQNLLPLVSYLYRKEEKLLVFDYISNGSLATHLHGKHSEDHPGLSWATRLKIIKGVTKGLMYLHNELPSLSVPHANLKSSNVLLDSDFNPLLMDYTLAPVVNPNQVQNVLVAYKSPDYANTFRVTKKADVWCLGILILEMLTGKFVIAQGCGHNAADLAGWIHKIVQEMSKDGEKSFDKEMEVSEKSRPEVEKLLHIGIACCEEDLDKRLDLEEAVKQIEQVKQESP